MESKQHEATFNNGIIQKSYEIFYKQNEMFMKHHREFFENVSILNM